MMLRDYLINLGFSNRIIDKLIENNATVRDEVLLNRIKKKIKFFFNLGYTIDDIIKMTRIKAELFNFGKINIKNKINDLIKLGYSWEDVIKMTVSFPSLFSLSIDTIKDRKNNLLFLGYNEGQVLHIGREFPAVFGYSISNMQDKILLLKKLGIQYLVLNNPRNLMQSSSLTYARYRFLLTKELIINVDNYRVLFMGNSGFSKMFQITKSELLNNYKYDDYKENKIRRKII